MTKIQFTTLIRLPFARGDFVDPPQADWNAAKDRALWKVISKSSKTSDLNCTADRYQVPQAFLLQQAAWLYERHLDHVRTQMKKVGSANAPTTSGSGSSHTVVGGYPMQRLGSGGSRSSRTPSALSVRPRDSPIPRGETTPSGLSRTPSTTTITQSRAQIQQNPARTQFQRTARPNASSPKQAAPVPSSPREPSEDVDGDSPEGTVLSSSSSESSESDMDGPAHRSQLFKRPPRFQKPRTQDLSSYDEEEADEGEGTERSGNVSLPFARAHDAAATSGRHAKHASVDRNREFEPSTAQRTNEASSKRDQTAKSDVFDASSSLASSASDAPKPSGVRPGPLSPKHRAELSKLSPRRQGTKRDGSEGAPSMGSSFSDIDDASISQSALEEALLSNIQHGRMSTLSQLRSRYL
ncbi:hypothetical protein K491DRAFT_705525 [Lophiostoma macrostomum CBS 122681]|uniref:Autophagy-related protein 29 n=1 Tax=Lophiostoma macrostomum CBS 122681 TaxID=1314788 RepID=A0A6A6T249_9PLEO|nr:hypothetical protein K491DRAFT_705525 [Lophiostoma macrostomum CBS 122681]